ncbi:hypothetical protein NDU88_001960 [Pleurodeles waltl]|uniref:Uncharacterized protein n=1 Tax=Pleurodeles waltl TaxID=8319 RepID=A0AAV7RE39_PLEWA|nr:hypothetical protein NDU88_001960 [Pleurodeles waltl]
MACRKVQIQIRRVAKTCSEFTTRMEEAETRISRLEDEAGSHQSLQLSEIPVVEAVKDGAKIGKLYTLLTELQLDDMAQQNERWIVRLGVAGERYGLLRSRGSRAPFTCEAGVEPIAAAILAGRDPNVLVLQGCKLRVRMRVKATFIAKAGRRLGRALGSALHRFLHLKFSPSVSVPSSVQFVGS